MSERQSTTPSSIERNEARNSSLDNYNLSPEQRDNIESIQEFADDIAKKRESMMVVDQDNLLEAPEHATPSRKNSAHNLQILLARRHNEKLEEEVRTDEDMLEDLLLEFQEDDTTGLSQEQKDEIIEDIINRTNTYLDQDTDESGTDKDEARKKSNSSTKSYEGLSMIDDMLDIPIDEAQKTLDDRKEHIRKVQQEESERQRKLEEERERIKQQEMLLNEKINQASKILNRRKRAHALRIIAEEHGSVKAADKILSTGRGLRNPFRFLGSDKSEHDRALEAISKKEGVSEGIRLEAAKKIKRGYARNRALGNIAISYESNSEKMDGVSELHGAGSRRQKMRVAKEVLTSSESRDIDENLDNVEDVVNYLDLSRVDKIEEIISSRINSVKAKRVARLLLKLPSSSRDKLVADLAVHHKLPALVDQISNPLLRQKTRSKVI